MVNDDHTSCDWTSAVACYFCFFWELQNVKKLFAGKGAFGCAAFSYYVVFSRRMQIYERVRFALP